MRKTEQNLRFIYKMSDVLEKNFFAVFAAVFLAILLVVTLADQVVFAKGCRELYDGVLRLHILANSDTQEDQQLKLKVRDRILQEAHQLGLGSGCEDLESVSAQAEQMLDKLVAAAQDEVLKNGSEQKVTACVTKMYFDTREYEGFTMPAGEYNAVRFTIGEGKGHNWWCVLFPQMCLPVAFGEPLDDLGFSDEELRVLKSRPQYEPRFALLEWAYSIREN